MKLKDMLYALWQKHKNPTLKPTVFEVTFNAVAGGSMVNLGTLNSYAPTGYTFVSLMPYIQDGTDTTIFGNHPEYMIYAGTLYIKTYKAVNNVRLQFYGVVAK